MAGHIKIGFALDQGIYHVGVINVYMAKAPSTAASFDGSGNVWFKVSQLSATTNGGSSIKFPADSEPKSSNLQQLTHNRTYFRLDSVHFQGSQLAGSWRVPCSH